MNEKIKTIDIEVSLWRVECFDPCFFVLSTDYFPDMKDAIEWENHIRSAEFKTGLKIELDEYLEVVAASKEEIPIDSKAVAMIVNAI